MRAARPRAPTPPPPPPRAWWRRIPAAAPHRHIRAQRSVGAVRAQRSSSAATARRPYGRRRTGTYTPCAESAQPASISALIPSPAAAAAAAAEAAGRARRRRRRPQPRRTHCGASEGEGAAKALRGVAIPVALAALDSDPGGGAFPGPGGLPGPADSDPRPCRLGHRGPCDAAIRVALETRRQAGPGAGPQSGAMRGLGRAQSAGPPFGRLLRRGALSWCRSRFRAACGSARPNVLPAGGGLLSCLLPRWAVARPGACRHTRGMTGRWFWCKVGNCLAGTLASRIVGSGLDRLRPGPSDCGDGIDEAGMGAGFGEGGEEGAEVEVVEVELGAAIRVGWVDPLAAREQPVSSIAARKRNA